jgi:hypothetical protein
VEVTEIASIDFVPSRLPAAAEPSPVGSWRSTFANGNSSTWVVTATPEGGYFAQEHGLGGAKGPAHFTASGTFRINYRWSGGAGFYEVRFAPDFGSAKGYADGVANACTWTRIEH